MYTLSASTCIKYRLAAKKAKEKENRKKGNGNRQAEEMADRKTLEAL
jgi:hypothetical protein